MISDTVILAQGSIIINWLLLGIMVLIYVGIPVLVISLMIRLVRYLSTAGKERKLLRIELGKLAEEVRQMREQRENIEETNSSQSLSSSETKGSG